MPPCIQIPRILHFNLDKSVEDNGKQYKFSMSADS